MNWSFDETRPIYSQLIEQFTFAILANSHPGKSCPAYGIWRSPPQSIRIRCRERWLSWSEAAFSIPGELPGGLSQKTLS